MIPPSSVPPKIGALTFNQRLTLYLLLIRWDRPAGTYLLLWPTLTALWLASGGFPGWHLLLVFVMGCFLMRSAGCAVNDVADRDFDRHVKRTAQRPVTSGLIKPAEALAVASLLTVLAFLLVCSTNLTTMLWSVGALVVTLVYPLTKRFLAMPQAILGVAFSLGIPMAFAAVQGQVPGVAIWWWLGNLFWVLAYDTEYAMVDRDDDLRIGIRTSAITLGRWDVIGVMTFYALSLVLWGIGGWRMGLLWPYFVALGVAAAMACGHLRWIRNRSREGCLRAFTLNHWLGLTVWLGVMASQALAYTPRN